jgi:hypothetical protein
LGTKLKIFILKVLIYVQFYNEKLHDLFLSPNIIRVMKSRRMRWAGHVEGVGERRGVYRFLMGIPEGTHHLEELGLDGSVILKWILKK